MPFGRGQVVRLPWPLDGVAQPRCRLTGPFRRDPATMRLDPLGVTSGALLPCPLLPERLRYVVARAGASAPQLPRPVRAPADFERFGLRSHSRGIRTPALLSAAMFGPDR
jgi:hypothetical protein